MKHGEVRITIPIRRAPHESQDTNGGGGRDPQHETQHPLRVIESAAEQGALFEFQHMEYPELKQAQYTHKLEFIYGVQNTARLMTGKAMTCACPDSPFISNGHMVSCESTSKRPDAGPAQ